METRTFTKPVILTTDKRPDDLSAGWFVLNAPRPIYGTKVWQGVFRDGVFYAAIDPDDQPYSDDALYESLMLDAHPVMYITERDIADWVQNWCKQKGYDFDIVKDEPDSIWQHFYSNCKLEWEFSFEDKKLVGTVERSQIK